MKTIYNYMIAFLILFSFSAGVRGQNVFFTISYEGNCEPVYVNFNNIIDTTGITGNANYIWHVDGIPYDTTYLPGMQFYKGHHFIELALWDDIGFKGNHSEEFEIFGTVQDFKISTGPEACPGEWINLWIEDQWFSTEWDFGDGTFRITEDPYPNHQYLIPGVYDITLIADNQCGTDTVVKQIAVSDTAEPYVEAYSEMGIYCINDEVTFHSTREFKTYLWNFGDGSTSTEKDPSHFYITQVDTSFTVTLTVTNFCDNSNSDTILVQFTTDRPAEAWFDYNFQGYYEYPCPNTPVEFKARVPGTYQWDFGDGSVSFERDPINIYSTPGEYLVTLYATNGCGNTAESSQSIIIATNEFDIPYVEFIFDVPFIDWDELQYLDTLEVCPGDLVKFENNTWSMYGGEPRYEWDFGDGKTSRIKDASHVYSGPGLYPVTLTASTVCGGMAELIKYVLVTNAIQPEASLGVVPRVICDGEQVFFFDEGDYEERNYVYSINFGDGEVLNNITEPGDTVLYTLANHTYTGAPGSEFVFEFSATNKCGNSQTLKDTITITDDPLHKPFYYVENSARLEENIPPADWGKRKDPSDHEMQILVTWPSWNTMLDTNFYILFWYGGFSPEGEDPGPADGIVHFTAQFNIVTGVIVPAYIPIDPLSQPVIGMAAGWFCSGMSQLGIEPDAWGMPTCGGTPVTYFNLIPGGFTEITSTACDGIIIDPDWYGFCNEDLPFQRSYYQLASNMYVHLQMWQDDWRYELYGSDDPEGNNWLVSISEGTWEILQGEGYDLFFYDEMGCMETGWYSFNINEDTMVLYLNDDNCFDRAQFLTEQAFIRKPDYGMTVDFSGCPGDDVLFKIAGGISYEWNFGDGGTSNLAYPRHAYSEPGIYDAYVVATNACGRRDTIYTRVTIKADNLPYVDFWWDKWDAPRFEPIQFMTGHEGLDQAGNNSYLWDFGDGNTSTAQNPIHAYERDGDYTITLQVTNGCGTNTKTAQIWIRDAVATCNAKFDYKTSGDTVTFTDLSWGEPSSWFWDFGNGFTSTLQNPEHTYDRDGIYFVCLSIFDENTNCASQTCREIAVGSIGCRADFKFNVNEALSQVQFTDVSTAATEWFWDFGDGTFSADQNPTHTYSDPGIYIVYLAIYNNTTNCFAETEKEIQVVADQADIIFADFSYFIDEVNKTVVFTDKSSAIVSNWYWTFGDGTYISERHPEHLYPRAGIYDVCLIVFDQKTGASAEICKKIPVGVSTCNINADFSFFNDIKTDSVTFNDKSTGNITKWFWNFGDGTTSKQKNPKHHYEQPGYYLVTLSVFNDLTDCADHVAEFIQIGTVDCRAFYEYSVDAKTNEVSFVNKSKGNLADYFWFFGDGSYSIDKDPVHKFERPGLYFVELTVVDASGLCMDFYLEPIQVGNLDCRANFSYFIDSSSNVAHFTPDVVGNITKYLWLFGDGSISTESSPRHIFTQPGYFTVGLNTFDAGTGCMDYYEEVILIGSQGIDCRAGFMYMTDPVTLKVKFTDKSRGNIVDWVWNFGDGSIGSSADLTDPANPTHDYSESGGGYYFVCLTVVNNWGITNTMCEQIQVAPAAGRDCRANFIFSADSVTKTVRFTDKSFGKPDGWFWNFGDGKISTSQNPVYTYNESGVYLVYLSIANSTTNCTSEHAELINVGKENQGLQADYFFDIDTIPLKADSYPVDFIGVSLGDGNKLKWDFGDGKIDTTSLQPKHTYTKPGKYVVCLTISNPVTGDSDTECDTLYVGISSGIEDLFRKDTQLANYPNPFSDITNIVYQLTTSTEVDLSIYDNSGRKIETLVSRHQDAGRYTIEYNGSSLDSGIYHLRLVTRNQVFTTMMIVR